VCVFIPSIFSFLKNLKNKISINRKNVECFKAEFDGYEREVA